MRLQVTVFIGFGGGNRDFLRPYDRGFWRWTESEANYSPDQIPSYQGNTEISSKNATLKSWSRTGRNGEAILTFAPLGEPGDALDLTVEGTLTGEGGAMVRDSVCRIRLGSACSSQKDENGGRRICNRKSHPLSLRNYSDL